MVVKIPGRDDLRIVGEDLDWQVQKKHLKGKQAGEWYTTNYFTSLDHAILFIYESILRRSRKNVDLKEALEECRKVKESLSRAVRRAHEG